MTNLTNKSKTKVQTFSGITFAEAKRIVEYEFAESVIKIERNIDSRTYEVHIVDIEKNKVEKFKDYWKQNFIIKVYTLKYEL